MESGKERKVCFIASSGGHWEELMCLKSVAQKYDAFYVTEEGGQANDASANLDKIYTFPQINRYESGFVKHFIRLFVSARKLLKQEKPDVVITTGALIAFPFCLCQKQSRRSIQRPDGTGPKPGQHHAGIQEYQNQHRQLHSRNR